jgi:Bifunctional DNA primase/polymerase, N-terminal
MNTYTQGGAAASPHARVAGKLIDSGYAIVGPKLVSQGFSAIPCRPGTKIPGVYRGDEWRNHPEWDRYAERVPSQLELETWVKWSGAGVCLVLGGEHALVAVDIDTTDHEVIAAVESVLSPSPVQRVGSKGYAAIYRGPGVKDTKFQINGKNAVEILARGRQVVIPPSVHPSTHKPYVWIGDALDRYTPDSLPLLPDDITERIAEALKPFGYAPEPERVHVEHAASDGDDEWRGTNEAALARLAEWVPGLGIGARREGASWRGNARRDGDSFALSLHPNGIKDFVTGEGFSPIDIVAKIAQCEPYDAMRMLRERLGFKEPPLSKFIFERSPDDNSWSAPVVCERVHPNDPVMAAAAAIARAEAGDEAWGAHSEEALELAGHNLQFSSDHGLGSSVALVAAWMMRQVRAAPALAAWRLKRGRPAQPADAEALQSEAEEASATPAKASPLDSLEWGRGVDWTRPSGDLSLLADYLEASARWPNRGLAVLGALTVIGGLCGRHLYGPTGAGANLYIAALASTGEGKDSVFKKVGKILRCVGQEELYESSFPHSNTALEDMMVDKPGVVVCVDEIGTSLFQKILARNAGRWEVDMKATINTLHSRRFGDEPFATKRHAKDRKSNGDKPAHDKVHSPSLSIFGIGTHDQVWGAIKSAVLEDGFMNRWFVIPIAGGQPRNQHHLEARIDDELLERLAAIPPVSIGSLHPRGVFAPFFEIEERLMPWESPDVDEWAHRFEDAIKAMGREDQTLGRLLARTFENTCSAALAHAVGRVGRESATITREDFNWAAALALVSARHMIENAEDISEDEFHAKYNAIRKVIKNGAKGTPGKITRRELRKRVVAKEAIFDEIIKLLIETGEIKTPPLPKREGRPSVAYIWHG